MNIRLRKVMAAGFGLGVLVPAAAAAAQPLREDGATLQRSTMGQVPASGASLLVTFSDVPSADQVVQRLSDLGRVRQSVPEIGVWELVPREPATARSIAATRTAVVRAEWSMVRRLSALPPRKPVIAPRAEVPVTSPTDSYYADTISGQWSLQTGRWYPSLTGQPSRPIIAILDSGLDTTHAEWRQAGTVVSPWSTIRNIPAAPDWAPSGHGTHVAGIAAAPMDARGVVGVAPVDASIPGARVMPVQIATSSGASTDATIMAGIVYAVNKGARVINISSGGPGYSQAFQDTVNWAMRKGTVIVASVGNEGLDFNPVNFPAAYDHVIGVGAQCDGVVNAPDCPSAFGRAAFSNANYSVDVLAPGVNIVSTLPNGVVDLSEPMGYGRLEGTSMAAPYVAGAAALVASSHPGITPHQLTRLIASTSNRAVNGLKRNNTHGWGVLNVAKAVNTPTPLGDLGEPNDDVQWIPKSHWITVPASAPVKRYTAWADYFDDPMDVYAVPLSKGRRIKVTISSKTANLYAFAFDGTGRISPRVMSEANYTRRIRARTTRPTPTARALVFRARRTGLHYIQVLAYANGGEYSIKVERLS